ncbi:MAG: GntR family transcriptional regulator [Alphaproteobacteria bacterium]
MTINSKNKKLKLKRITSRGPLAEKVYQNLKEAILQGWLRPGAWLHEQELTEALGVSRTPLREAFNRLGSQGLLEIIPRKGVRIVDLTEGDIDALFEARAVLETAFFVKSAKKIETKDIKRFRLAQKEMAAEILEAEENPALLNELWRGFLQSDREFHELFILASGNDFWIKYYYDIRDKIEVSGRYITNITHFVRTASQNHNDVMDAVLEGKFEQGRDLMGEHIRNMRVLLGR